MELKKKYNLFTAIAMVVGIVVGSGVFFKSEKILNALDGNMWLSILAWVVGGLVMIVSAYTFSLIASSSKSGELADMAEETVGRRHSYSLSWYCAVLYYPLLVGVLGWVCADFTGILFNVSSLTFTVVMTFVYITVMFAFNMVAPKIAGMFQVSTTVIKLIPLIFMALVGTIFGFISNDGTLIENFTSHEFFEGSSGFMTALVATCFAYEGWIVATTISKELKNPKKDLPKALVIGTLIVLGIYLTYYVGLSGTFTNDLFMTGKNEQVKLAFMQLLGNVGGTLLYVFVVISCIGTLNGLTMGTMRNFKSIADTNNGPCPEKFKTLNKFNVNTLSWLCGFILSLILGGTWLLVLYKGLIAGAWWAIDISELIIIFVYIAYIPMYISVIKNRSDLNKINRFVMPSFAIGAALLMITAAIYSHKLHCLYFLFIVLAILGIGQIFYKKENIIEEEKNV